MAGTLSTERGAQYTNLVTFTLRGHSTDTVHTLLGDTFHEKGGTGHENV